MRIILAANLNTHNRLCLHGYSLSGIGKTIQWSSIDLLLLIFLTDILLIKVEMLAVLLTIALIWEVIFGFVFSVLFERFLQQTPTTYRKLSYFSLAFSLPSVLAYWALFTPPPDFIEHQIYYVLAVMLLFRTTYIMIDTPNNALLVTLSTDSNVRTKLSSLRSIYSSLSSLLVSLILYFVFKESDLQQQIALLPNLVFIVAIISLVTLVVSAFITAKFEEKPVEKNLLITKVKTRLVIKSILANKTLLMMIITSMICYLTFSVFLKSVPYYAKYIVGDGSLSGIAFFLMTITQTLGFYLCGKYADQVGKLELLIRMYAVVVILGVVAMVLPITSHVSFIVLCCTLCAFTSSIQMLLWATIPDAIDANKEKVQYSAAAMGFFASLNKMMKGLAPIVISAVYFLFGFEANIEQSEQGKLVIKYMMLLLPSIGALIAMLILKKLHKNTLHK